MEKLLRTEAEAALDDVVESCKAAADHHDGAAAVAPPDLKELFAKLGGQRRKWAQELEEEVRGMGNLPSAPDADLEAVDQIVTRVKVALSHSKGRAFITRALKIEEHLTVCAEAALRQDLPPSAHRILKEVEEGSAAARERLSSLC